MSVEIDVVRATSGWDEIVDDAALIAAARAALEAGGDDGAPGELCISLSDDAEVADLNARWRGKEGPTNVLSFALDHDDDATLRTAFRALGDVVLARETVLREAQHEQKSPDDHACHLVAHGVLHLLGYDHQRDDEAERMEAAEILAMRAAGRPNPYGETSA